METLVWMLAGLVLIAVALTSLGTVPLASVVIWLFLVSLMVVMLVVFGVDDPLGGTTSPRSRR